MLPGISTDTSEAQFINALSLIDDNFLPNYMLVSYVPLAKAWSGIVIIPSGRDISQIPVFANCYPPSAKLLTDYGIYNELSIRQFANVCSFIAVNDSPINTAFKLLHPLNMLAGSSLNLSGSITVFKK